MIRLKCGSHIFSTAFLYFSFSSFGPFQLSFYSISCCFHFLKLVVNIQTIRVYICSFLAASIFRIHTEQHFKRNSLKVFFFDKINRMYCSTLPDNPSRWLKKRKWCRAMLCPDRSSHKKIAFKIALYADDGLALYCSPYKVNASLKYIMFDIIRLNRTQ